MKLYFFYFVFEKSQHFTPKIRQCRNCIDILSLATKFVANTKKTSVRVALDLDQFQSKTFLYGTI